jgi:uncharacterized protein YbjQ (UPF0145 family)
LFEKKQPGLARVVLAIRGLLIIAALAIIRITNPIIARIREKDVLNTTIVETARDIAYQEVLDEAKKLGAQKVSVQLVMHVHPKLGKSYTATGVAYRCGK